LVGLPVRMQNQLGTNFKILEKDPTHPSLHVKRIARFRPARVSLNYRALAVEDREDLIWF
jgi:hypothetical protein